MFLLHNASGGTPYGESVYNVQQLSIKLYTLPACSKKLRHSSLAKAGFSYSPGWHTLHHPFTMAPNPSDREVGTFLRKTDLFRTCFSCSFTSWAQRSCCRLGSGRASRFRIVRAREGNVRAAAIVSSLHSAFPTTPVWASNIRLLSTSRVAMYRFVVRFRDRKFSRTLHRNRTPTTPTKRPKPWSARRAVQCVSCGTSRRRTR